MDIGLNSATGHRPDVAETSTTLESAKWRTPDLRSPSQADLPPPSHVSGQPSSAPNDTADDHSSVCHWRYYFPSWLASLVVHLAIIVALALLARESIRRAGWSSESITASIGETLPTFEGGSILTGALGPGEDANASNTSVDELIGSLVASAGFSVAADQVSLAEGVPEAVPLSPTLSGLLDSGGESRRAGARGDSGITMSGSLAQLGGNGELTALADAANAQLGNGLANRISGAYRAEMIRRQGGTPESEYAVRLALKWLAEHQLPDGSWSFQHTQCRHCLHRCGNDGSLRRHRIASTAMALLPFLGAGQTHQDGEFRRNVDRGLYYLVRQMTPIDDGGSLWDEEGRMYGHGLASIALCEAYGMTRDRSLREPAQQAINFIVSAQDPTGGGWRYSPRQPGDTSVVGWQLMALRSAELAYLNVPAAAWRQADYFLDSVQADGGSQYGYVTSGNGYATSAIGVLGRMFIGWELDHPPLARGIERLAAVGPSTSNAPIRGGMYFNYYATQVLHHVGGPLWEQWNESMRDYLVSVQATRGHERGSWFINVGDMGAASGGRLYCTAMAAMTLEVYYRYSPIYGKDSLQPPQLR